MRMCRHNPGIRNKGAERGGFEPPAPVLPVQLLSRQPCSATPAPLRRIAGLQTLYGKNLRRLWTKFGCPESILRAMGATTLVAIFLAFVAATLIFNTVLIW